MAEQEVWITLRLKGYVDAEANVDVVGQKLLAEIEDHLGFDGQDHGFKMSQPGDVLEIEEEAQIYDSNEEDCASAV